MEGEMVTTATFYAWAVPAFTTGSPVDHTWVTIFDNQTSNYSNINAVRAAGQCYWFCWGGYHAKGHTPVNPTGALGNKSGSLPLAKCLVKPNADSRVDAAACGTIFTYGVDGVCHQLANQVLYATKTSTGLLTVSKARGYWASTFVYGTYGLQQAAWAAKIRSCSGVKKAPPKAAGGVQKMMGLPDDFEEHVRDVLAGEPEMLNKLLSLTAEVRSFAAQPIPGFLPPNAETLNSRNQHLIDQAAILLGPKRFEQVFGMKPGDKISLVDPTLLPKP
jgi:hypothetical protein